MKTCLIVAGVIVALFFALVVGGVVWFVYMLNSYQMPDAIVRGADLKPAVVEAIDKKIGLRPGETIEFFYSGGVPPQASGLVVTNERIIQYNLFTPLEQAEYAAILQVSGGSFLSVETDTTELLISLHENPVENAPLIEYLASQGKVGIKEGSRKIPGEHLLSEEDLTPRGREAIEKFVEFQPGEEIVFLHTYGFWTFDDGGSVVTDRRIIEIWTMDGEMIIEEAPFDQIVEVIPGDASLEVEVVDGDQPIFVSLLERENMEQVRDYLVGRGIKLGEPRPTEPEDLDQAEMESEEMDSEAADELLPADESLEEEAREDDSSDDQPSDDEVPATEEVEESALP